MGSQFLRRGAAWIYVGRIATFVAPLAIDASRELRTPCSAAKMKIVVRGHGAPHAIDARRGLVA